jgi:DedD protein
MEKKQAIILLFLVLAVSLVSFSLGVMVGRGGGDKPAGKPELQPIPPQPTGLAPELQKPAGNAPGQLNVASQSGAAAEAMTVPDKPADTLTFYETLPRGDQPLGSGINLPPDTADKSVETLAAPTKEIPSNSQPATTRTADKTVTARVPAVERPAVTGAGSYVVQVASFKDAAAAAKFEQRLTAKGYQMFVEPADLGSKGIWHRVYAGPFADKLAAERIAGRLLQQEKISPLVRKR